MESEIKSVINVEVIINASIEKVWKLFTSPEDIVHWNNASEDWHTVRATNDLQIGGKFSYRMEAKDGSEGFDFGGIYTHVIPQKKIDYTLLDDRKVNLIFSYDDTICKISESFEAEDVNTLELQQYGWQCILNNFKLYVENN